MIPILKIQSADNVTAVESSDDSISSPLPDKRRAKRYARIKLGSSLFVLVIYVAFILILLSAGYSGMLVEFIKGWTQNSYIVLLAFSLALGISMTVMTFPIEFAVGFLLERMYGLSDQGFSGWLWHGVKGKLISTAIFTPLILMFYMFLLRFGELWWLPTGALIFGIGVLLGRLAPTLIFPLFYRFEPLPPGEFRENIHRMAEQAGMRLHGIYRFNLSKTTKKANAAFAGIGRSKRVLLGDTLLDLMTEDEVLTVLAHELGHYKLGHVPKLIAVGAVSTFAGLGVAAWLYSITLHTFGFGGITDIGALPLLSLWLMLYSIVTGPLNNSVSRTFERQADRLALEISGDPAAFVSALGKLAGANLADVEPHPMIEFLFHSHPAINKRLAAVDKYVSEKGDSNGLD